MYNASSLLPEQKSVLARIAALPAFADVLLGGGAALGLHLGHRQSKDLDYLAGDPARFAEAQAALERMDGAEGPRHAPGTLHVIVDGVPVSLFLHEHRQIDPPESREGGVRILSLRDLAAMKLAAVGGRGARKDFIDLYVLGRHGLLIEDAFACLAAKYGAKAEERYHLLRAIVYFDDAEKEPMPMMLLRVVWEDVKAYFQRFARDSMR